MSAPPPGTRLRRMQGANADGQIGVRVDDDVSGAPMVRLDRGAQELLVPFRAHEWFPAEEPRLERVQVGRVAYSADHTLRMARGEYGAPDWMTLREGDRIAFAKNGPPATDPQRRALWLAICHALGAG